MDLLTKLRDEELRASLPLLGEPCELLELGGGSGLQAKRLAALGFRVRSLDVDDAAHIGRDFPVERYDGTHLPFPDASFDRVFSSNVLEHVRDLPATLAECRRVLRPGGRMVHVMPSVSWRAWTIASYYVFALKYVAGLADTRAGGARFSAAGVVQRRGVLGSLVPGPHGEFPSALSELTAYRDARWRERFAAAGWRTAEIQPLGLFYTGYSILPGLGIPARRRLSNFLGSSTHAFVVE